MKKIPVILTILLALVLTACGGDQTTPNGDQSPNGPNWTFSEDAVFIDEDDIKGIQVEEDRVIVPSDHKIAPRVKTGALFVGGDVDVQLLRRVTDVSEGNGEIIALTQGAALTDAFDELDVDLSKADEIFIQTEGEFMQLGIETRSLQTYAWQGEVNPEFDLVVNSEWEIFKDDNADLRVSSDLNLHVGILGSIVIKGKKLNSFTFESNIDYTVTNRGIASFTDAIDGEKTLTLIEPQKLLALHIGPLWLTVDGSLDAGIKYNLSASGNVEVGTQTTGSIHRSVVYTAQLKQPWNVTGTKTLEHTNVGPNIVLTGSAEVTPFVEPSIYLLAYDQAGLRTNLRGSLPFTAQVITTDPQQLYFGGDVGANLTLTMSGYADVWGLDPTETDTRTLWESDTLIFAECAWSVDVGVSEEVNANCCFPLAEPESENACICGDTIITEGETCDSSFLLGETCEGLGYTAGTLTCDPNMCVLDESMCSNDPIEVCGDNQVTGSEECDGTDLSGQDCITQGFTCGDLACDPVTCTYDIAMCTDACGSAVSISAGSEHTCALLNTGAVRCWGDNNYGQLGYGNTDWIGDDELPFTAGDVNVGGTVLQIDTGSAQTCALLNTGAVRCWGYGLYGQLGYGNTNNIGDDEFPFTAGDVNVGGTVTQIAAGEYHTCTLLNTGTVRCWGYGLYGGLGYGNPNSIGDDELPFTAGDVNVGGTVTQIAAGYWYTCALLNTGTVRCWGYGVDGQLGYGNTNNLGTDPATAGDVNVGGTALQIDAGHRHTCALLNTGTVRCWGYGDYGQLGYGNRNNIGDDETPASAGDVNVGGTVTQIAAGRYHTCALLNTGAVRCWGDNNSGQLGYGNTDWIGDDELPFTAGDVNVGGTVTQIAAGRYHTCALLNTGTVRCWGFNSTGQLGYGNTNDIGDDEFPFTAGDVPFE